MRIFSILTSLTSGGAETLVLGLNAEFVAEGHESIVATLCDARQLGNSPEMEARLKGRIEADGGRVISLGLGRRRGLLSGAWAMRAALRLIQPDIIHAHTARALPMLAFGGKAPPVVLTHHNTRLSFPPILFRLFDRQVRAYVAISCAVERLIERHSRRRIVHIPNAAAAHFGVERPRLAPRKPPRILSVGAVSAQKNYGLVLEVAKVMRERGLTDPQPTFMIAGSGPGLDLLRQQAEALGLGNQVQFLGERSDIAGLMRDSDLFLNSSLYEGMPIALLEAMAMALPVMATDVPGTREVVQHERTGLLAKVDDPLAIARSIARVLNEPGLYRRLSAQALADSERYSMAGTARRHLSLYERIVCHGPVAGQATPLCSEG